MKKYLIVLVLLLISSNVSAQSYTFKRNDAASTTLQNTNGQPAPAAVDNKGVVFAQPGPNASPFPVSVATATPIPAMTPVAMITVLPTAVPTAAGTPQFANSADLKSVEIKNTTNVPVRCNVAGMAGALTEVSPGSTYYRNLRENGQKLSVGIGCFIGAGTPTPASGYLTIGGDT